jgi:hypothetical protein
MPIVFTFAAFGADLGERGFGKLQLNLLNPLNASLFALIYGKSSNKVHFL